MNKKRKLFLTLILISTFLIYAVAGISFLENFDETPIDDKKLHEKAFSFLVTPFERLLNREEKVKNEKLEVVSLEIPILMYHYVEIVKDEKDTIRKSLNTEPKVFENQVITLKNNGYKFIWPKEIPEILKNKDLQSEKYIVISFDDGYKDFYTDAYPILKRHNIKAVNYIPYYFLDKPNYMSSEDVKKIAAEGLVEIGSHTLRHTSLTSVSKEIAFEEILNSKKYLETKFEIEVKSFAYPYGFYDKDIANMVEKAGYTNAVTVEKGKKVSISNLFTLQRIRPGFTVGESLVSSINN